LNIRDLKQYLKRKQIIALIVIVVIVVSAAFVVSQVWQPQPEEFSCLEIIQYKIEPTEFKVTENGTLFLDVRNKENSTVKCDYYFETHNNVKLYLGVNLLQKLGDNYTHTRLLNATERSYLEFTVVASLDIGDNKRSYYIKVYIYADDVFVGVADVDFWVTRGG
jgi:uncharacterized membrane protein